MRLTFISHFIICMAVIALGWFIHLNGGFTIIYSGDKSRITSIIGALFVLSSCYIGWQTWNLEKANSDFGYLVSEISVLLGVIGMAYGLSLQGQHIALSGNAAFEAWATQLYATICGCIACLILLVMTFNLEQGLKKK